MNRKHDHTAIIQQGMELFWSRGFNHLGVDEICRTTGMTKGAFYNAFRSKENFLLRSIDAYGDLISDHLQSQLSESRIPAYDRLLALYDQMLAAQPESNYIGCLVNNMMSELGSLNPAVADATRLQFEKFLSVIRPIVAQAQKDGEFRNDIDARALTEIIHTTFFGILTRCKSTQQSGQHLMKTFFHTLRNS